jgi:hypothetical protein
MGTGGDGCPAQTTVAGAQSAQTTIEVGDSDFFYVGDVVTFGSVSPSGTKTITAIPDQTHITLSTPVTVADGTSLEDCRNTNFDSDATNLWHQQAGCTGNCGATIHLFFYAGYDEASVWQEFGEMMFQDQSSIPRVPWGNPNPKLDNRVVSRYVDWTSWLAGEQQWGESTSARARARARSRTRSATTSSPRSATTTTTRTSRRSTGWARGRGT